MKTLSERLAWARTQKEWSQQELADKAKVGQSTIASLESGSRKTARKLTAIASALEVSSDWLAEGRGPRDSAQQIVEPAESRSTQPRLQWITDEESELLSLYRACEKEGRGTTMTILKSLANVSSSAGRADQG